MPTTTFPGCTQCCPGAGESCCGCTGVQDTLTATISNINFCACVDGVTVIMTYQGGCTWQGFAPVASACNECIPFGYVCLFLRCFGGFWQLSSTTFFNPLTPPAFCTGGCGGFSTQPATSVNCSPFVLTFDEFTSYCDDGLGDDGEILVTITP